MHASFLERLYNANNSYAHAIYLNNVWLTSIRMVCITYQIGYAMYVVNVLILCMHPFLKQTNVIIQYLQFIIYLNNVWLTVLFNKKSDHDMDQCM